MGFAHRRVAALAGNTIMPNEPKAASDAASPADWSVSGTQSVTAAGVSRVEVLVRGKVTGAVDRGDGTDQLRVAVWDDGQEKDFKIVSIPLGRTGIVNVRLGFEGRYATVADGIGIVVTTGSDAGGEHVFHLDPFVPAQA